MADPTIQTFCCRQPNITRDGVLLMTEFNTKSYNAVCLLSSSLGIVGALYQILPREDVISNYRWIAVSGLRGRQIIIWLAVADLLASFGVFVRSSLWLNSYYDISEGDDLASILVCAVSSAWIQYFYTATWIWTLCYAIDMWLLLQDKAGHPNIYHISAWLCPAVLTLVGLCILYIPDADCHQSQTLSKSLNRILPNYFATYLPIAIVMIVNPYLYTRSSNELFGVVSRNLNQFTRKERNITQAIKIKFSFINLVFYVCWLPNIINGVLLWTLWFELPIGCIIALWYLMAVTNPLQALLNCLVYRQWSGNVDRVYIPHLKLSKIPSAQSFSSTTLDSTVEIIGEDTPLLQSHCHSRTSINDTMQKS